ncbi:MAG: response regulator [Candidatus Paceibacterota bacterium]|jgi:DNA-binding response OmpR family regulator
MKQLNERPSVKILLVESDQTLAKAIKEALKIRGYTIVWVEDGKSILHTFGQVLGYFRLIIICDCGKAISGQGLCQEIRKVNRELPIIVMNTDPTQDFRAESVLIGPNAMRQEVTQPKRLLDLVEDIAGAQIALAN